MTEKECIEFLRWCLPKMQFRWEGFRRVRRQVCKRIQKRLKDLALRNIMEYREYLESHPAEWDILDSLCHITISRFYRDKKIFDEIRNTIFPLLINEAIHQGINKIWCWSAGCASGEEPYTLRLIWDHFMSIVIRNKINCKIIATDSHEEMLKRARKGIYPASSLKDLPEFLKQNGFQQIGNQYQIADQLKKNITFLKQDIRREMPDAQFQMILCRNLVFTYFSKDLQSSLLKLLREKLQPGGFLIIGSHEALTEGKYGLQPFNNNRCIFRRVD